MPKQKVNEDPRISINKISEYLVANPSRRKKIIYDQKYPQEFIVKRYNEARSSICDYFVKNNDFEVIMDKMNELNERKPKSDWESQDIKLSLEALDYFIDMVDDLDLNYDKIDHGAKYNQQYEVSGVKISVNPDLVVFKDDRIGGINFAFSKNYTLSREASEYHTSLLWKFLEETQNLKPLNRLCVVIDIFSNSYKSAPRAYKQRMQHIEDACFEISRAWNEL